MGNRPTKQPPSDLKNLPAAMNFINAIRKKAKPLRDYLQIQRLSKKVEALQVTGGNSIKARSCREILDELVRQCAVFQTKEEEFINCFDSGDLNAIQIAALLKDLLKLSYEILASLQKLPKELGEMIRVSDVENAHGPASDSAVIRWFNWGNSANPDPSRSSLQEIGGCISLAVEEMLTIYKEVSSTVPTGEAQMVDFNNKLLLNTLSDMYGLCHTTHVIPSTRDLSDKFVTGIRNFAVMQTTHFQLRSRLDILIGNCEGIARGLKPFAALSVPREILMASSKRGDYRQLPTKKNSDLVLKEFRGFLRKPSKTGVDRAQQQTQKLLNKYRTLYVNLKRLSTSIEEAKCAAALWREKESGKDEPNGAEENGDGGGGLIGWAKLWIYGLLVGNETVRTQRRTKMERELNETEFKADSCLELLKCLKSDVKTANKGVKEISDLLLEAEAA